MSNQTEFASQSDVDRPNVARIYDYLLGGYHNFEADRALAERATQVFPDVRLTAIANRAFLRRVVRFLVGQGMDQFLDIGSGLPTVGNVHEIAQAANPATHVVYVDKDPVAVAHSEAMLTNNSQVAVIQADVCRPDDIFNHPKVRNLLDFSRPIAVLLVALLNHVTDDDVAYDAVRTLRDAVVPGSFMAISQSTYDGPWGDSYRKTTELGGARASTRSRTHAEIFRFFDGLEWIEPGLVFVPLWHPEGPDDVLLNDPSRSVNYGGIGRKP